MGTLLAQFSLLIEVNQYIVSGKDWKFACKMHCVPNQNLSINANRVNWRNRRVSLVLHQQIKLEFRLFSFEPLLLPVSAPLSLASLLQLQSLLFFHWSDSTAVNLQKTLENNMPQLVKMTGAISSFSFYHCYFLSGEKNLNLLCYNMCGIFKRKVLIFYLLLQDTQWKSAFPISIQ